MQQKDRVGPGTVVVSTNDPVRGGCWFYKCDDVFLVGNPRELAYGLGYPDSRKRHLTVDQFGDLIHDNRGKKRVVLIKKTDTYDYYRQKVPEPSLEHKNSRFVFA
jgi:hypothetical protein